ncbi:MAG TPA: hypothetical protein VGM32_10655, partial [Rhodopila sp.]
AFFMVFVLYVYTLKESAPYQTAGPERSQPQTTIPAPPNVGQSIENPPTPPHAGLPAAAPYPPNNQRGDRAAAPAPE